MANNGNPGGYARPDDQGKKTIFKLVFIKRIDIKKIFYPGNLLTCTRFALSKSMADGLMRKIFVAGKSVDIEQDQIKTALLNEHKDGEGKWPEDFHAKYYQLQDKKANYWIITLSVVKVNHADFLLDLKSGKQKNTYVLVYMDRDLHCVYVKDCLGGFYHCINSHGISNPNIDVPILQANNTLYSVHCGAQPMSLTKNRQIYHKSLCVAVSSPFRYIASILRNAF